jgi:hypothetical protein
MSDSHQIVQAENHHLAFPDPFAVVIRSVPAFGIGQKMLERIVSFHDQFDPGVHAAYKFVRRIYLNRTPSTASEDIYAFFQDNRPGFGGNISPCPD